MTHGLPPRIGPFAPTRLLAVGGMARVVVAERVGAPGERVALKLIRPELADDAEYATMFLDESRINSRVVHPNVVKVFEYGRDPTTQILYMAMELVLGATLTKVIRGAALPTAAVLEIVAQAADGLGAAHRATAEDGTPLALVHRDVSPPNLLLGLDGVVRLGDFGVARAAQRLTRTRTGQFKGKLDYCSPEQALGHPLDHRSDLFSLGIVAWELLARRRLFDGNSPYQTLEQIVHLPVPRVTALRPDVSPEAARVLDALLDRDVGGRPPSADEVSETLRAAGAEADAPMLAGVAAAVASPAVRALSGLGEPAGASPDEASDPLDGPTVIDRGER